VSRFGWSGTLGIEVASGKPSLRLIEPEPSPADEGPLDLEEAFARFAPYVASIGLRILGRRDEVDDLVQDVFLVATRGLENVRDPRATKAWLATITVRTARRKLRRRRLKMMLSLDEAVDYEDITDRSASPETRAMLKSLYQTLDRLPTDERIAWTLRYVEGEKLDRIALLCSCSLATAKRRIGRAHDAIVKAVGDG
jgi:RNA polymerase sigma-70 factor (ECF subfamily)